MTLRVQKQSPAANRALVGALSFARLDFVYMSCMEIDYNKIYPTMLMKERLGWPEIEKSKYKTMLLLIWVVRLLPCNSYTE